jgi:hypothetical protein
MTEDRAELSSLAAMLGQVSARITAIAERAAARHDDVAKEVFGIERALLGVLRRLDRFLERALRD